MNERPAYIKAKEEITKPATEGVAAMAQRLHALKNKKDTLEADLTEVNKEIDQLSRELAEAMETHKVTSFRVDGVGTVYITNKTRASVQAGAREEFFAWLDKEGMGALAVRAIHPKRLESLAKEFGEQGRQFPKFPDGSEMVSVFVQKCATIRRK